MRLSIVSMNYGDTWQTTGSTKLYDDAIARIYRVRAIISLTVQYLQNKETCQFATVLHFSSTGIVIDSHNSKYWLAHSSAICSMSTLCIDILPVSVELTSQ